MDPMDYILHQAPRQPGHYDPVHSASSSHWQSQDQNHTSYPWPTPNQNTPYSYPHYVSQPMMSPGSDPFQLGQGNGLPPPIPNYQGSSELDSFAGGVPPRYYNHVFLRPGPVSPYASRTTVSMTQNGGGPFANQIPLERPPSFSSAGGLSFPHAAGPSEPSSLHRLPYTVNEGPANGFGQNNNMTFPHLTIPPPPPPPLHSYNLHLPQRDVASSSDSSSRNTVNVPLPTRHSPTSSASRRSQPRPRRGLPRTMSADLGRDEDDEPRANTLVDRIMRLTARTDGTVDLRAFEEELIRELQIHRGTMSSKMVVSKRTLRTLQTVDISELPETEKTCVICYNEYGVETPEGTREAPVRLPKCKHVFGDHCIKKWFEDSDSCPYCRDKLQSEPKMHHEASARARNFLNLIRMQGNGFPDGLTPSFLNTAAQRAVNGDGERSIPSRQSTVRRPPTDGAERQRRTRARHSNPDPSGAGPSSSTPRPDQVAHNGSVTTHDISLSEQVTTGHSDGLPPMRQHPREWELPRPHPIGETMAAATGDGPSAAMPGFVPRRSQPRRENGALYNTPTDLSMLLPSLRNTMPMPSSSSGQNANPPNANHPGMFGLDDDMSSPL